MNPLRGWWLRLLASLWFVPMLVVLACLALALVLIDAHGWIDTDLAAAWPRLFGAGVDGGRGMLSAIATSMITVAGVVLSVTIVALSQASTQYSPRVLRNFMADRPTQLVLGIFVGVFVYCLVVLRTIRSEDENGGFLPSLAILGGLGFALIGVAALVYYIHHVAASIQAASIVERIHQDTQAAIDRLFPDPIGEPSAAAPQIAPSHPAFAHEVASVLTGYLVELDDQAVMEFARKHDVVVWVQPQVGDFVVEGEPLVRLSGPRPPEEHLRALHRLFKLGRQRTVDQDATFGVQQLVDIAVKALSPGINDPTTAVMCVDRLCALSVLLSRREIPSPYRAHPGEPARLRVIAHGPDFDAVTSLAFDPIADHAHGEPAVLLRLLDAMSVLERRTRDAGRRQVLKHRAERVAQALARGPHESAWQPLRQHCRALELALERGAAP